MAKHTPEPWRVTEEGWGGEDDGVFPTALAIRRADDDGTGTHIVASFLNEHRPDLNDLRRINYDRIVAAVNACAGLDDAALALLPTLLSSYENAGRGCDRLLAAAKEALPALKDRLCHHQFDTVGNLAVDALEDAIAFAETTRPEKEGE